MRCPQCNKRNSVAAASCSDCDYRFKKKPVPFQVKFFLGFLAALVLLWGVASAIVPRLADNQVLLTRAAKSLAHGPKSQAEATKLAADFDRALQEVLKNSGSLKDAELSKKLQTNLPSSLFEVHIFTPTRNIKLVEVDNVLHVSDYLVWVKQGENIVLPVSGLDVFDDSTTINDPSGKYLVLLGHTAGQTSHRPNVKVFAMAGNELTDQTEKLVPRLPGEGTVTLERNKQDIAANLSLLSIGQSENLFGMKQPDPLAVEDETVRYNLIWQSGHYWLQPNPGKGQLFAIFGLARCVKDPSYLNRYQTLIGVKAKKQLKAIDRNLLGDPNFLIQSGKDGKTDKKQPSGTNPVYTLLGPKLTAKVELEKRPAGPRGWAVSSVEVSSQKKVASEDQVAEEKPAVEPLPTEIAKRPKEEKDNKEEQSKPEQTSTANSAEDAPLPETPANEQASETKSEDSKTAEDGKTEQDKTPVASSNESNEGINQSENEAVAAIRSSSNSIILRKGPGTTYGAIEEISKGTPVQVLGQEQSWYKVRANGKEGFVYAGLLQYKKPDAYTVATIRQGKGVTDESNRKVASLQVGDRLVVLGGINKNNKYKVQLANGKVGYVDKDALDVTIDAPPLVP